MIPQIFPNPDFKFERVLYECAKCGSFFKYGKYLIGCRETHLHAFISPSLSRKTGAVIYDDLNGWDLDLSVCSCLIKYIFHCVIISIIYFSFLLSVCHKDKMFAPAKQPVSRPKHLD